MSQSSADPAPNHPLQRTGDQRWFVAQWPRQRSGVVRPPPLSCCVPPSAPGGMRELSSALLVSPPLRSGENQEFDQMPLRGTAQLAH